MMTALAETRLHHVNTGRMESSDETRSFIGEPSRPAAERGDGPGLALAP